MTSNPTYPLRLRFEVFQTNIEEPDYSQVIAVFADRHDAGVFIREMSDLTLGAPVRFNLRDKDV